MTNLETFPLALLPFLSLSLSLSLSPHTHQLLTKQQLLIKQQLLLSSRWGWPGTASAADCPQGPVCGVIGYAKVHTLGLPVSAHWGGSDGSKHQVL